MTDLGAYCTEKHGKGQEMACLQEHLEDLSPDCHDLISDFTEDETDDLNMDKVLMKACLPMIKKYCGVRFFVLRIATWFGCLI